MSRGRAWDRKFVPLARTRRVELRDIGGRSTIFVSDTHLQPTDNSYCDDAPTDVVALLKRFQSYDVIILGDFIEGLALTDYDVATLCRATRLQPLWRQLSSHPSSKLVLGNHDMRAARVLRQLFGRRNVHDGLVRLGRLLCFHGHSSYHVSLLAPGELLSLGVVANVTLSRLGLPSLDDNSNGEVALALSRRHDGRVFSVFGHTHQPELTPYFANTGCFLRHGTQSFATIDDHGLVLWGREMP